jgi:hypothetical protein
VRCYSVEAKRGVRTGKDDWVVMGRREEKRS